MLKRAVFFFCVLSALPAAAQDLSDTQILHLLNRATFGPASGDIDTVRRLGVDGWLDQQLHPERLTTPPMLAQQLSELTTINQSPEQLSQEYAPPRDAKETMSPEELKEVRKKQAIIVQELTDAKIWRAIESPAQLQEVMVDFWFNHFNVFAEKGTDRLWVGTYERDAIRPYALGKFGALLEATAHHPAMLVYLDNAENSVPRDRPDGKKIGINENYAREIMELHTLGVNGGYTQNDVTALAHILTGWGLGEGKDPSAHARFFFEPRRHDFSDIDWLGYRIKGGGEGEIETVLNVLAHHPATAHHIAYQLAQYFVADDPPPALVDRLSKTFLSSDGDMKVVLRTLFKSQEFWDARNAQQKFKPPFRYVVSAFRAANAIPGDAQRFLAGPIAQMGEPLYRCLTPNGYAMTNDQWLNSDALLKRIEFSKKLASALQPDPADLIIQAMGATWTTRTSEALTEAEPKLRASMLLSSPEFVYY